ncbi:MAG: F0F1 ATP synthase subunit epsilon [Myxococcota bacterium]
MLQLEVFTPNRAVLELACDRVQLPGVQGQMTVLPGHSTLLAQLSAGTIYVQGGQQQADTDAHQAQEGQQQQSPPGRESGRAQVVIAAGFAWVQHDRVRVLCDEPAQS